MKFPLLLGIAAATLALGACSTMGFSGKSNTVSPQQAAKIEADIRARADYWQRADAVSAQYLVGPKAQHQLHMDIASCVSEVREMVRLGSIAQAMPPKNIGMDPGLKSGWSSPTRNGPLYTEYTPYQDFDGCMNTKGWERSDFVGTASAVNGARTYNRTILGTGAGMSASGTAYATADGQPTGFNQ